MGIHVDLYWISGHFLFLNHVLNEKRPYFWVALVKFGGGIGSHWKMVTECGGSWSELVNFMEKNAETLRKNMVNIWLMMVNSGLI